jgi:hypothetical protein
LTRIECGVKTGQGGYSYQKLVKLWSSAEELEYDPAWFYYHFHAIGVKSFVLGFTADTDISPLEIFRDTVAPELR